MKICVYCASSSDIDPAFFTLARDMGAAIGRRGDTLVWGGGRIGLMGEVARAVHDHGGTVVGVIPKSMTDIEIAYTEADELIVTETMRERKHVMDERSDAFVVLPGGFGTLEELSEMMVQRILGYTHRPIVLVNAAGFYDPLLELFRHFIDHGFARRDHLDVLHVVERVGDVYPAIEAARTTRATSA